MSLPSGNRIVDAIVAREGALLRNARAVVLERSQTTMFGERSMETVDFPVTSLMSVFGTLEDGSTCELASIGTEGFVEIDAALHASVAKRTAMCLFGGQVVRVPIADFQAALESSTLFARLVFHAVRMRVFITEQIELCNAKHPVEQRLARWLLLASHRMHREDFSTTQEQLGHILGTRRSTVSTATSSLENGSAIKHSRNALTIADRTRLEASTCECYHVCLEALQAFPEY